MAGKADARFFRGKVFSLRCMIVVAQCTYIRDIFFMNIVFSVFFRVLFVTPEAESLSIGLCRYLLARGNRVMAFIAFPLKEYGMSVGSEEPFGVGAVPCVACGAIQSFCYRGD